MSQTTDKEIAKSSLEAIENIGTKAEEEYRNKTARGFGYLGNTFNNAQAYLSNTQREELYIGAMKLTCISPIYASIWVKDCKTDEEKIFYFTKGIAPCFENREYNVANFRAPLASLLAQNIGDFYEVILPNKTEEYQVLQKNEFVPKKELNKWDSSGVFYFETTASKYPSLRTFLYNDTILSFLDDEETSTSGKLKRDIISSMGLREKPILDKIQDRIYREDGNKKVILIGPPGTGKTTTLIKKLGLNLDPNYSSLGNERSWYMFTPTELLKNYLKEAFNRENIAAHDDNVYVWDNFRSYISRNILSLLETAVHSGFVKIDKNYVKDISSSGQQNIYEQFFKFQNQLFLNILKEGYKELKDTKNNAIQEILTELDIENEIKIISACKKLETVSYKIDQKIHDIQDELKNKIAVLLKRVFFQGLSNDESKEFLLELQKNVDGEYKKQIDGEIQENEEDDIELNISAKTTREIYEKYLLNALQGLSLNFYSKKRQSPGSFSSIVGKYINFDENFSNEDKNYIGQLSKIIKLLRLFKNPAKRYLSSMKNRYKLFRKEYKDLYVANIEQKKISNIELDILILSYLNAYKAFKLNTLDDLMKGQIFVDEITDFSSIQISIMNMLLKDGCKTFFGAGDLNQRLTEIGITSFDELKQSLPGVSIQEIKIPYRQSKQLFELSQKIIDGDITSYEQPKYLDIDGLDPVIGYGLNNIDRLSDWLSDRIIEIEQIVQNKLPSIAILVNSEQQIEPLQKALNDKLASKNIEVDACLNGQILGSRNNVRIFSVDYIKGLEFEAAFFIGVDELANIKPDIFEKFLYVGISRAATFLGVTVTDDKLPNKISSVKPLFRDNWI